MFPNLENPPPEWYLRAIDIRNREIIMKTGKIIVMLLTAGVLCAEPAAELPKIKVALAGSSACQTYNSKDPKLIWG